MAFDAVIFMRTRMRGTPSWPGHNPETGYVGADRSDHLAQTPCGRGGPYVLYVKPKRQSRRESTAGAAMTPCSAKSRAASSGMVIAGSASTIWTRKAVYGTSLPLPGD